ncbi:MAG: hypothetical protein JW809_17270 [Pirellulales bacterium]|nr:hypothetical protein [Pirellulales bacterium]
MEEHGDLTVPPGIEVQSIPGQPNAYLRRAAAFGEKGDWERATQDWDYAVSLDPKSPDACLDKPAVAPATYFSPAGLFSIAGRQ